ncbi:homoserine dehydrogenase [Bacillaceae bacterium S4-13-56]
MRDEEIKIGLLGLGTVGSGVVHILQNHQEQIMHQVGCPVVLKKILVKDVQKKRETPLQENILTDQPSDLLEDSELDILIEVMGGVNGTYEILKRAVKNGKHIVTANKDLMAVHGSELLRLAKENQVDIFYEASVAGGIPIIRALAEGLASDRITKLMGIVNGTTNYILTKMTDEQRVFEDVLKEAQDLGYAEADPTSDVDGLDAARKMTILATLAFSTNVDLDDVEIEGIRHINEQDIKFAEQLGYRIKLIGIAAKDDDKLEVSVQPVLLPIDHPLAGIKDEFNAVYVYGEAVGETMFYGPGAGKLPTATAIVSDLIAVVKNLRLGVTGNSYIIPQYNKQLKSLDEIYAKFFIRLKVEDQPGTFLALTTIFTETGVSFDKILQLPVPDEKAAEVIMITHTASKRQMESIMKKLENKEVVHQIKSCYRVEGD